MNRDEPPGASSSADAHHPPGTVAHRFASRYVRLLGREIHYVDWGEPAAPAVIAWHGLARTGRDMDELAHFLSTRHGFRVVCPDTIGRGLSQWSPAPDDEYALDFYARLAVALMDALALPAVRWVGTSMGGAVGIALAGGPHGGRITRLVVNDSGPELAAAAVARIRAYAGQPPAFATVRELESFYRTVYAPFGFLSDREWTKLAETSMRRLPDGRVTPHYDPAIVRQFERRPDDYLLWAAWDRIACPVLCLRGEKSDLLLPKVCEAMRERGPCAEVLEVAGCGHAPALNVPGQLEPVAAFLAR